LANQLDVQEADARVDDLRDVLSAGDVDGARPFAKWAFAPSAPACIVPSRPVAANSTRSAGDTPRCASTTLAGRVRSIATSLP
jgi:hypothetical protein